MRFVLGGRHGLAPDLERVTDGPVLCVCGHARDAHEHLRRGSDCGSCGRDTCRAFARAQRTNVIPLDRPAVRPVAPKKAG